MGRPLSFIGHQDRKGIRNLIPCGSLPGCQPGTYDRTIFLPYFISATISCRLRNRNIPLAPPGASRAGRMALRSLPGYCFHGVVVPPRIYPETSSGPCSEKNAGRCRVPAPAVSVPSRVLFSGTQYGRGCEGQQARYTAVRVDTREIPLAVLFLPYYLHP